MAAAGEMVVTHVLRRLIDAGQLGGKVHGPPAAVRGGLTGTVFAQNAHLSRDNGFVAALRLAAAAGRDKDNLIA